MGVVLWNNATSVSGMTTPAGRGPNVGWCARAVISTELRARAAAGESKAALAKAFGVSRETVYSYLRIPSATIASSLTAGEDRPTPDITKYDQLLTRIPDPISPTEDQDATPQEADEKPRLPRGPSGSAPRQELRIRSWSPSSATPPADTGSATPTGTSAGSNARSRSAAGGAAGRRSTTTATSSPTADPGTPSTTQ
jgi:hypothetical protein